jgi:CheY-like chemotaxis protein
LKRRPRRRRERRRHPQLGADWKFTTLRPLDEARAAPSTARSNTTAAPCNRSACAKPPCLSTAPAWSRRRDPPETVSGLPVAGPFLAQSQPLPGTPWTLTVLQPSRIGRRNQRDPRRRRRDFDAAARHSGDDGLPVAPPPERPPRRARSAAEGARRTGTQGRGTHRRPLGGQQQLQDESPSASAPNARCARPRTNWSRPASSPSSASSRPASRTNSTSRSPPCARSPATPPRFLERGDEDTARANLERIAQLVDRMGQITGQLKTFARKSSGQLHACRSLPGRRTTPSRCSNKRVAPSQCAHRDALSRTPAARPVRRQPARTGHGQPDRQRARRDERPADALVESTAPARRAWSGLTCATTAPAWSDEGPPVRAVLHDQGSRRRPRPRPGHLGRHRARFRRHAERRQPPGRRRRIHPGIPLATEQPSAMSEALKVLIIEDDPDVRLGCEQALQLEGIATESVGSAEEAQRRLGRTSAASSSATSACRAWTAWPSCAKCRPSTRSCRWC